MVSIGPCNIQHYVSADLGAQGSSWRFLLLKSLARWYLALCNLLRKIQGLLRKLQGPRAGYKIPTDPFDLLFPLSPGLKVWAPVSLRG